MNLLKIGIDCCDICNQYKEITLKIDNHKLCKKCETIARLKL